MAKIRFIEVRDGRPVLVREHSYELNADAAPLRDEAPEHGRHVDDVHGRWALEVSEPRMRDHFEAYL